MEDTRGGPMLGAAYVKDRKIGELFQTLIASLVCHRPEDHISFLLQNLIEIRDEKDVFLSRLHSHVRAASPLLPPLDKGRTKSHAEKHARKGKSKLLKQQQTPEPQNQDSKRNVTNLHPGPLPEISDLFGVSGDVANQIKAQPRVTLPVNLLPLLQKSKHRKPPFRTGIVISKDSRQPLPLSHLNNSFNGNTKAKPPLPGVKQVQVSKTQNGKHTKGKRDTKDTESVYLTDGAQELDRKVVGKKKKGKHKGHVQPVTFTDLHTWPTPQESLELLRKQDPICHELKSMRPKVKWRSVIQHFKIRFNKISHKIDEKYLQDFHKPVQTQRLQKRKQKKSDNRYLELEDRYANPNARKVPGGRRKKQRKVEDEEMVDDNINVDLHGLLARKKHILEETHYDNAILIKPSPENNLKWKRPQIQRKKAIRRRVAKRKAAGKERRRISHFSHEGQKTLPVYRTVRKTKREKQRQSNHRFGAISIMQSYSHVE